MTWPDIEQPFFTLSPRNPRIFDVNPDPPFDVNLKAYWYTYGGYCDPWGPTLTDQYNRDAVLLAHDPVRPTNQTIDPLYHRHCSLRVSFYAPKVRPDRQFLMLFALRGSLWPKASAQIFVGADLVRVESLGPILGQEYDLIALLVDAPDPARTIYITVRLTAEEYLASMTARGFACYVL